MIDEIDNKTDAMRITVADDGLRVELDGTIDHENSLQIYTAIAEAACRASYRNVLIDLRRVDFIDSAGLGLFGSLHNRPATRGKVRIAVLAGSQPERLIQIAAFDKLFPIETREDCPIGICL